MGTMMALYHRDALHGKGQEIDVSLYEGIFRFMEILCADYDKNCIITVSYTHLYYKGEKTKIEWDFQSWRYV